VVAGVVAEVEEAAPELAWEQEREPGLVPVPGLAWEQERGLALAPVLGRELAWGPVPALELVPRAPVQAPARGQARELEVPPLEAVLLRSQELE
jgi:hypothetical protein